MVHGKSLFSTSINQIERSSMMVCGCFEEFKDELKEDKRASNGVVTVCKVQTLLLKLSKILNIKFLHWGSSCRASGFAISPFVCLAFGRTDKSHPNQHPTLWKYCIVFCIFVRVCWKLGHYSRKLADWFDSKAGKKKQKKNFCCCVSAAGSLKTFKAGSFVERFCQSENTFKLPFDGCNIWLRYWGTEAENN